MELISQKTSARDRDLFVQAVDLSYYLSEIETFIISPGFDRVRVKFNTPPPGLDDPQGAAIKDPKKTFSITSMPGGGRPSLIIPVPSPLGQYLAEQVGSPKHMTDVLNESLTRFVTGPRRRSDTIESRVFHHLTGTESPLGLIEKAEKMRAQKSDKELLDAFFEGKAPFVDKSGSRIKKFLSTLSRRLQTASTDDEEDRIMAEEFLNSISKGSEKLGHPYLLRDILLIDRLVDNFVQKIRLKEGETPEQYLQQHNPDILAIRNTLNIIIPAFREILKLTDAERQELTKK